MRVLQTLWLTFIGAAFSVVASAPPFGLSNRVANTTLRLPPAPPVFGYVLTNAFPSLNFANPLVITAPAGETNRLFIAEQGGRVAVITNLAAPTRTVFLDISSRIVGGTPTDERGLLGLVFHPGYATNRFFYVYYSLNTTTPAGSGLHQRLARFEASPSNPAQALSNSEVPLLTMQDDAANHNGGDLHFGPEGYLYVALGDEGDQNDGRNNSQLINKDFWSSILRLDVDRRPGNLVPNPHPAIATTNYFVPADNPFVGVTNFAGSNLNPATVRTEIYALGFRNPWRMFFDRETGFLYCADVGGGAWEEIDIVVKGGNYGWAYREGLHPGPKPPPPGFTSINPIQEYGHGSGTNQGNSVTGGVVYRGNRLPSLYGWYVFADYVSGNVWALHHDGTNTVPFRRLTGTPGISTFGIDPATGDVLAADQGNDVIKRLIYVPVSGFSLPPTLAEAGAFAELNTLTPHAGIVPYDVNVPYWSDGADQRRWFSVPNPSLQISWRATNNWTSPTGTVWIQHFEIELTNGVPESRRRLETRFLVRDAGSGVYGVAYRWDPVGTNATLVPEAGMDETLLISDGGLLRTQVWHYPSRSECLRCHTPLTLGGLALGFNTAQLNRDFDYGGVVDNQLRALNNAGYFQPAPSLPTNTYTLRALAPLEDESWSVEARVRSYLAANCSQCHQPAGSGRGNFDTRPWRALSGVGLVDGLLFNDGGNADHRVIKAGSLDHSMVLTRMLTLGNGRMPPVGTSIIDPQGVALLSRWITNDLPASQNFTNWQRAHFGSTNAANALANADPDNDRAVNFLEWLTKTSPTNSADFWQAHAERASNGVAVVFSRLANRGFEVEWAEQLSSNTVWRALNVPGNNPFFAASNGLSRVSDRPTNGSRFYRVRAYEP